MENKKEIKKKILTVLATELSKYGFDRKIHGQSLWKPIAGGRAMIHISFMDYIKLVVNISVSVRIDVIEDMINTSNNLLTKSEKIKTSTVGIELGNLVEGRPKDYSIDSSVDVDEIIYEIVELIKERAFPFIEKYINLENIMEVVLRDDRDAWQISPFHHTRAQTAVALAKILGRKDLESIIESKREFLESRNDFGLHLFNKFADIILNGKEKSDIKSETISIILEDKQMKLDKNQQKELINVIRKYVRERGYKFREDCIYKVKNNAFIHCDIVILNSEKLLYSIYIKNYEYDNIFWKIMQMEDNVKESDSLRANGAFISPSILLKKGEMELSDKYEKLATELTELIDINELDFLGKYDIDEYLIEKNDYLHKEILKCLAYINKGKKSEAIKIAQLAVDNGKIGGYINEGKGFFEWLLIEVDRL